MNRAIRHRTLRIYLKFARGRFRLFVLTALVFLIVIEIVALMPSAIEEGGRGKALLEPDVLISHERITLAPGIPSDQVPEYSVEDFNYVSTENGQKQWKLLAMRTFVYHKDQIVHARRIKAFLYDPDGKITVVTGMEAKYLMNKQRDLEVFGNVHTVFPDGFVLESDYLHYNPKDRKIDIPQDYFVSGNGTEENGQQMSFQSYGLDFNRAENIVTLPKAAVVNMIQAHSDDTLGVPDKTTIVADHCVIYRGKQLAVFTMNSERPSEERFVRITQPKLFSRGRRAELNYSGAKSVINYMVAYEDVFIKDTTEVGPDAPLKYATSGRADFERKRDVIILTEFPQAYQGGDTVTGDVITLHRDSDVVEVEHSNSFSQGEPTAP